MTLEQQQQLENVYVMHTFGRKPVDLVRGEGMHLWDDAGREYLDFLAGIGVISLGHCHPALVKALTEQTATLMHVGNYYYIEGRGELAKKISDFRLSMKQEVEEKAEKLSSIGYAEYLAEKE